MSKQLAADLAAGGLLENKAPKHLAADLLDRKSKAPVPTTVVPPVIRPEQWIPLPFAMNGSRYGFQRHDCENFKRRMAGIPVIHDPPAVVEFVRLPQFARELGISDAQLKRWVAAARAIQNGVDAAEAHSLVSPKHRARKLAAAAPDTEPTAKRSPAKQRVPESVA
jgi:hypothetical protein